MSDPRIARPVVIRFAVGSVATGGFVTLPALVLVPYVTDVLGGPPVIAGLILLTAKLLSIGADPLIGSASDRSLARSGTRRPMMVLGALALPVMLALVFAAPVGLGAAASSGWVWVTYLLATLAASTFLVPYFALPAELTRDYDERTRLVGARVVAITVGTLLIGAGGSAFRTRIASDEWNSYLLTGIAAAVVMVVALLIATTAAPRSAPHPSVAPRDAGLYRAAFSAISASRPFRLLALTFALQALASGVLLTVASYEATWVLHSPAALGTLLIAFLGPALISTPIWVLLSRRFDKRRTLVGASVVFVGASVFSYVALTLSPATIVVPAIVSGIGFAGIQTLTFAMLPDVISADSRHRGAERAGAFTGVWAALDPLGTALGAVVVTGILGATGYESPSGGTVFAQPPSAATGIILLASLVPGAIIAVSLFPMLRYPLRKPVVTADTAIGSPETA